jgi:hypothetical protein
VDEGAVILDEKTQSENELGVGMMKKETESGQAIVLLVFAVLGLIGFTALAIDGGMVFSDRRHAQSASDAASLAAGGFAALALENYHIERSNFNCSDPELNPLNTNSNSLVNKSINIGLSRAYSNDYTSDQVSLTVVCEDNGPVYDEKYLDFTTVIIKQTQTSLIHFVYDGPAVNQVEATVRVRPRSPGALGNAIVALNDADCSGNQNGVILGGSSGTYVTGGGIFSNGCLKCNGSGTAHQVIVEPYPNGIFYVGNAEQCSPGELSPDAVDVNNTLEEETFDIGEPTCPAAHYSMNDFTADENGIKTLEPGTYTKIDDGGEDKIFFKEGLYCVTGKPNAIKISTAYFLGYGVTFFVTQGGVQITGTGDEEQPSRLMACPQDAVCGDAIPGTLLYLAHENESTIKLTGNSDTEFSGTVYAPDGNIVATGTGDSETPTNFGTQLIANNVEVAGNAIIDINFMDDDVNEIPAWIDLLE